MTRRRCAFGWLLVGLCGVVACGDDTVVIDGGTDGGVMDGGADAADASDFSVAPPEAVRSPEWPCPEGWEQTDAPADFVDGISICAPVEGPENCGMGEARFMGEGDCAPLSPCPASAFADVPAGAIYVTPTGDGDGSEASPTHLVDALRRVAGPTTIALSAGEFEVAYSLPDGVRLVGLCPTQTRLIPPAPLPAGMLQVAAGRRVEVRNVAVEARGAPALAALGTMVLHNVSIDGAAGAGVYVTDTGRLEANRLVVRDTSQRSTGSGGPGVIVDGGQVVGEDWIVRRNVGVGVWIRSGDVSLRRVASTAQHASGSFDAAAALRVEGGTLELQEADFQRATNFAVELHGGRSRIRDLYVDSLHSIPSPLSAVVHLTDGASLDLERAYIRGRDWLVHAWKADSLRLADAVLINDGENGRLYLDNVALTATETVLDLERVVVAGGDSGIIATGELDTRIRLPDEPPLEPLPLLPYDFRIRDLQMRGVGRHVGRSYGLSFDINIVADVGRLFLHDVRGTGVYAQGAMDLSDAHIEMMRASETGRGSALSIVGSEREDDTATVQVTRAHLEQLYDVGINVTRREVSLRDVHIGNTARRPCDSADCRDYPGGTAIGAFIDAQLDAERIAIRTADLCGVHFALDSTVRLRDSLVRGASIGACVQVDGFDLAQITDGVRYEDNGTNIETTMLVVPEPVPPPGFD